jgi:hypothetical protein
MHKLVICTYNFKGFPPFYNLTNGKNKMDIIRWERKVIKKLHLYNHLVKNQTMCEYLIHLCLQINNFKFKFQRNYKASK